MMEYNKQIEEMTNDHFAKLGKMDKEKQIKEMAREIDKWYPNAKITNRFLSESLYNAGYRKSTDVAREIFEDVEKHLKNLGRTGYVGNMSGILAELRKKHLGEDINAPTKESEKE
jgi:hypothetical protein